MFSSNCCFPTCIQINYKRPNFLQECFIAHTIPKWSSNQTQICRNDFLNVQMKNNQAPMKLGCQQFYFFFYLTWLAKKTGEGDSWFAFLPELIFYSGQSRSSKWTVLCITTLRHKGDCKSRSHCIIMIRIYFLYWGKVVQCYIFFFSESRIHDVLKVKCITVS